jgi:hypothetical protein
MPRNLVDLSADERKELLNHVWDRMVATEIASPSGTNEHIASPLGTTGKLPHDLAPHLQDMLKHPGGGLGAADWKILNGSCAAPDAVANAARAPGKTLGS